MSTDVKKRKRLEQARQAGEIEPERDVETNKIINPHNPEFISKRPWYLGDSGPSLNHHSKQKVDHVLSMSEADELAHAVRAAKGSLSRAKKFRPGACKNCGAMGHKTIECVERPQSSKKAAWKSGKVIAKDDIGLNLEQHGKVSFDAKRDRWHGYHQDEHKVVVDRYRKLDEERRKLREEEEAKERARDAEAKARAAAAEGEGNKAAAAASDSGSDTDSDAGSDSDDEDKDFVQRDEDERDFQGRIARQGGLGGAQMATTVRNLRIREDRAKYLYNLDPESAYYDPKTRSMRDNPNPNADPTQASFAGDNFSRYTGDVGGFARTQVFAWDAADRGQEVHPLADPSQAELLHKNFEARKSALREEQKKRILDKYGGQEQTKKPDARLLLGQTEDYVEYDRTGRVIKGAPVPVAKSKYEEDVHPGNHSSVWGSFFDRTSMRWGYACCHSLTRGSYCTGAAGIAANDDSNSALSMDPSQQRKMLTPSAAVDKEENDQKTALAKRSELFGENLNPTIDEKKLKKALKKAAAAEREGQGDDKAGKYNSFQSSDVTQEEMEAYRMRKQRADDPMNNISSDKLLDE
jgi:pre-mRNA-processing factor SLU7